MTTIQILIGGMTCQGCVSSIEKILQHIKGVQQISVSLTQQSAQITFDSAQTNSQILINAIEEAGFDARLG